MPKYYCDYCEAFLTHDSPSVRKTHMTGKKHKTSVRDYYQKWLEEHTQRLIDQTTAVFRVNKAMYPPGFMPPRFGMPPPMFPPGKVPMIPPPPGMIPPPPLGMMPPPMGLIPPPFIPPLIPPKVPSTTSGNDS